MFLSFLTNELFDSIWNSNSFYVVVISSGIFYSMKVFRFALLEASLEPRIKSAVSELFFMSIAKTSKTTLN